MRGKGVPISPQIGRLLFDDAAKDLITEYTINRRRSLDSIRRRIDLGLTPWFRGRRMVQISTADVRAYVEDRQKAGKANATINRELAALKRMFKLAIQAGKLLAAPHIPMLREDNARQGFFEREQFEAVRRHLPSAVRPVLTFGYLTGWRIKSEVLPLQWHQVDLEAGIVRLDVGTTKNREGRNVSVLGRWLARRAPGGPASRYRRSGEEDRADCPVGLPSPPGPAGPVFPALVADRVRTRRLPGAHPA